LKTKIKLIWALIILLALFLIAILVSDNIINNSTKDYVYNSIDKIPANRVGLLLGTSKFLKNGNPNNYFNNRIIAVINLFNAKKIEFIVISGDNSTENYNEPQEMKNELIKSGIPENKIFLDYAGFRTYDSVIRLNKILGQTDFTIISQEFHNQRAIYIAQANNLKAIGYNAEDIDLYNGFKTQVREKLARLKVFIDLLIEKEPKFLGEKIEIK
jgi:SanA protein